MKRALVFLLLMVLPVFGLAATIHVPADQPTIQAGIDAAVDGDTVLVAPGTYVENIDFLGKAITVISDQGPEVTIIDGGSPSDPEVASVVTFENDEGPDSILEGFTLTNGTGSLFPGQGYNGGGVFTHYSSPTITGNIITGNLLIYDYSHGGGIFANHASPTITGNTISGNQAAAGGGIDFQFDCHSIVDDNTIIENTSPYFGAGITVSYNCDPVITNNVISGNAVGEFGGGVLIAINCSPTLTGNTIDENSALLSGGGIYIQNNSQPVITNNIITGNSAVQWGGGLYCWGAEGIQAPTVSNNIFIGNWADEGGGAISCNEFDSMTLSNNTITGNESITYGGGIECWQSSLTMINTIFWNNTAPTGPEIWLGDTVEPSTLTISYSDVEGGMGSVHVEAGSTLNWGEGMIDEYPEFCDGPGGGDHCHYFLSHAACGDPADSPCIGTGDPTSELIQGATRTDLGQDWGVVDMGYHYPREVEEFIAVGPGPAGGNPAHVRVFPSGADADPLFEFSAYGAPFGVNAACGDVNVNEMDEIITGPGSGPVAGPHVRGFQADGTPLPGLSFLAYGTNRWGVNVAAGDIDADGFDEIITGAGPGAVFGPHVRGWNYDGTPGVEPLPGVSYFAYGTPKWGVNVSAGDIDGDGYDEIVTGAGPGAVYGPHVRGWNVDGGPATAMPTVSFLAYGTNKFGVKVTCGDVDGDGIDEIVTGPGPGGMFGAHVRGWNYDGASVAPLAGFSFFAWQPNQALYGANVYAGADLDGDGRAELVVGCGPDPDAGTVVKVYHYDGSQITGEVPWFSLDTFGDLNLTHGTTVAAGRF